VTINQAVGQADPTTTSSINFTAVFSEPVQTVGAFGFTCADVLVINGTCSSIGVLGLTYTVTVTASSSGVVSVSIPAGGVKDVAGNLNTASTITDNSVTYTVPGVPGVTLSSITSTATEGGATGSYTIVLNTLPTANVSITLNSGAQVTVSTSTIVFTTANWNVAKTITVTAVNDTNVEGTHTQIISHTATSSDLSYNNISIQNNTVTITDNDVAPVVSGGGGGGSGGSSGGTVVPNLYYVAPVQTQYINSSTSVLQISNKRYDPNKEYGKLLSGLVSDPGVPKEFAPLVCKKLLKSYINLGANNIKDDVRKLQLFLNEKEGENLVVDSIYKKEDFDAVKRFQSKYQDQILLPWGNKYPTGNVNRTTVAKINAVSCADASGSACPYFKNYLKQGDISDDVVKLQDFLNLLSAPTSGYPDVKVKLSRAFGPNTFSAVKDFQETYKDTVLKPWGLKAPSGWFYKTSIIAAHQLMNCNVKTSEVYTVNLNNTISTTTTTSTATPAPTQVTKTPLPLKACFQYSNNLKLGDKSYEVIVLQQALNYLGFYGGKRSGSFGPETRSAILEFQKTYGLQNTGELGPVTGRKISSLTCN
jgi:peptidoglycan hydrolase-like protein with peptidoglycan-binding domain